MSTDRINEGLKSELDYVYDRCVQYNNAVLRWIYGSVAVVRRDGRIIPARLDSVSDIRSSAIHIGSGLRPCHPWACANFG